MKILKTLLIAVAFLAVRSTAIAQEKFTVDDGINSAKKNILIISKNATTQGELLFEPESNESIIKWQTLKESNTSHFELQISYDGTSFTDVKRVAASDFTSWKTNYQVSFRKSYLSADKVYYRLKSIFINGIETYTEPAVFKILSGANKTSYASLH